MSDDARAQRAKERAGWPGRVIRLEDMPEHELVGGSVADRIALVTQLTLAAWAMRGEPIPTYSRSEMPGRVIRRGKPG